MIQITLAQIVTATRAEGPGLRMAIWVQGCPLRCPGCCNPEMLKFEDGEPVTVGQICRQIEQAKIEHQIEGLTLLGGEPFSQAEGLSKVAAFAQANGLTVTIFSGHLIEELRDSSSTGVADLLSNTDMLIDGPYDREQPDTERRWIGSKNQRIHFLTNRYSMEDDYWSETDTLEIRLKDGELSVNGFPAKSAIGMWKRPKPARSNKPVK